MNIRNTDDNLKTIGRKTVPGNFEINTFGIFVVDVWLSANVK